MYPHIAEYGLIGDCHSAALVSRAGSIDWCCLPRFDSDSCFGRILDWKNGGSFQIAPVGRARIRREYLGASLVLATTFTTKTGEARVIDFFAMREGGRHRPRRELIRIIEGLRGTVRFRALVSPRLDFGEVKPWISRVGEKQFLAVGSNTGLMIYGTVDLERKGLHDLNATFEVHAQERQYAVIQFVRPEEAGKDHGDIRSAKELSEHFDETMQWWQTWTEKITHPAQPGACIMRSAIALKALTYAPTGAIIAAPTTSLPETIGGERNWDYRYSWLRDSIFIVDALANVGAVSEADDLRRFIERSAAGHAEELQVMYGIDGKRRLTEIELSTLSGWRNSKPVRIGNAASKQYQGDMFGLLLELAWRWTRRSGNAPEDHYWTFLTGLVEAALLHWKLPDYGIWEIRSKPRHFVHSKVMCWAAVARGIQLAEQFDLTAPLRRWRKMRDAMRREIETRGYNKKRGIFVQSFASREVDAALLLIPDVDFVPYDDPRMIRTAEAIQNDLGQKGFILRYRSDDGLSGQEGVFVACTFWLAECFAKQGKREAGQRVFDLAMAGANDLGLFAEEYSARRKELLGNFPQGLTHLAHISAALALAGAA